MSKRKRNKKTSIIILGLLILTIFYVLEKDEYLIIDSIAPDTIHEQDIDDLRTPVEFRNNVEFWKDIFLNKSIFDIVYFTPDQNINIKQIELRVNFSLDNDGLINIIMLSDGEEIEKFNVIDLIDKDNVANILYLQNIRDKIDEIYDQLDKKLHDNNMLTENEHIGYTRGRKEKFQQAWKRSGQYIDKIKQIFRATSVPTKIAYLAFTESAFDFNANSNSNALGIFQMIPSTARKYGLIVNKNIDERRDPLLEATAAAKYLQTLYAEFDNWLFAINAYHSGENNLRKALKWAEKFYPEKPIDYPGTLREYQYIKVVQEFAKDKEFNNGKHFRYGSNSARYTTLFLAFLESISTLDKTVTKDNPVSFKSVKVNYQNDYFQKKDITIQSGDTLSKLSYIYGVNVEQIKKWNNMQNSLIYPGDTIHIIVENPPINIRQLVEDLHLSKDDINFLFRYNFSYKTPEMDVDAFLDKKLYSNTTLNIPLDKEDIVTEYIGQY